MSAPAAELRQSIMAAMPRLMAISDQDAAMPLAPGKWSAKQVIGHLIDSASNNHQRFVRARFSPDLIFTGYDSGPWVDVQQYWSAPWQEILILWQHYNIHLARVMEATPEEERMRPRTRHNLHQLAMHPVPEDQPATLDYFMGDYVDHLNHHLTQILGKLD